MARLIHLILLLLELRGLRLSLSNRKWQTLLVFYTQLSNLLTVLASLLLVLLGQPPWVTVLRYASVCMLIMTFFVTTCVLVPMGGDPKKLLFSGNGLYHHLLCPVLSTLSYFLVEAHAAADAILLPLGLTLIYGLVMLDLNRRRIIDGPYSFFRVYKQTKRATVLWFLALLCAIAAISAGIWALAK